MNGAWRPVEEEGLGRCVGLVVLQPVHGLFGEVLAEVVARLAGWLDRRGVAVKARLVLGRLAREETVEILEAIAGRPGIERPRGSGVPCRRVVPFAEGRSAVAVLLEHFRHGRRALGNLPGVAVPVGGQLGDDAVAYTVMVAPGEQRGARRRADGGGVEGVVSDATVGDAAEGRRVDATANGVGLGEASVVEHDHQDVGRILGEM
ncbi:hypothetical protein D9M69_512350 [compost metagenome]